MTDSSSRGFLQALALHAAAAALTLGLGFVASSLADRLELESS